VDPEHDRVARHYDLADIGILHGPPMKGACIVTEMTNEILGTRFAAFAVFDEMASEVVLRSAAPKMHVGISYPLHKSVVTSKEYPRKTMSVADLAQEAPESGESLTLRMGSLIAASVFGPDQRPVGALVGFGANPRRWTRMQKRQIADLAYLITQEIALYASFATLGIISSRNSSYRL
jgi:hypothetical protein